MEQNENATAQAANNRPALALRTERGLLKMVLLGIITFGIYPLVVECHISEELNMIASKHDGRHTMHFIWIALFFSWLTMGIVPLVWYHRTSDRMGAELRRRQIAYDFGATDFWLWDIIGSIIFVGPFIYTYKRMQAMNLINADFNAKG